MRPSNKQGNYLEVGDSWARLPQRQDSLAGSKWAKEDFDQGDIDMTETRVDSQDGTRKQPASVTPPAEFQSSSYGCIRIQQDDSLTSGDRIPVSPGFVERIIGLSCSDCRE